MFLAFNIVRVVIINTISFSITSRSFIIPLVIPGIMSIFIPSPISHHASPVGLINVQLLILFVQDVPYHPNTRHNLASVPLYKSLHFTHHIDAKSHITPKCYYCNYHCFDFHVSLLVKLQ